MTGGHHGHELQDDSSCRLQNVERALFIFNVLRWKMSQRNRNKPTRKNGDDTEGREQRPRGHRLTNTTCSNRDIGGCRHLFMKNGTVFSWHDVCTDKLRKQQLNILDHKSILYYGQQNIVIVYEAQLLT